MGNSNGPEEANMIYSAWNIVAGSWYNDHGAAADPLCLPPDPQYLLYQSGYKILYTNIICMVQNIKYVHTSSPLN